MMNVVRHFTATGFVVHDESVLLHWHPKVKEWLPPGGHIEDNEDPVQAVLREIREETGLSAEIVPTGVVLDLEHPVPVHPPFTILVENIHDPVEGYHQHIDMIYFCRLPGVPGPLNDGWIWVSRSDVEAKLPLAAAGAPVKSPPEDVRLLAMRALDLAPM